MHLYRTSSTAALTTVLLALGAALGGCSSSGPGTHSPAPQGTSRHAAPSGTTSVGRTTATFTASRPDAGVPTAEEMRNAAERLRKRAAALGLTGAQVRVSGTTITVTAPGTTTDRLQRMAATAELEFRPVLDPAAAAQNGLQSAYAALSCTAGATATATDKPAVSRPDRPTVACDRKRGRKYLLAPAALGGADVQKAAAGADSGSGGRWTVTLHFNAAGADKFTEVTGNLAQQTSPANELAILLDGQVLSAPAVASAITGGEARITGDFTQDTARDIAALVDSGALPVRLTVRDITQQS
jgi:preprotein translocase subunit SecD